MALASRGKITFLESIVKIIWVKLDLYGEHYILLGGCEHKKVDYEYEFLHNKFPFLVDFYYKIKICFWIMKVNVGDINYHIEKQHLLY